MSYFTSKSFLYLLIFILVAEVFGGLIWIEKIKIEVLRDELKPMYERVSSHLEVENLQTYRNEKYGFEFKYSNTETIVTEESDHISVFLPSSETNKRPLIAISIYPEKTETELIDELSLKTSTFQPDKEFLSNVNNFYIHLLDDISDTTIEEKKAVSFNYKEYNPLRYTISENDNGTYFVITEYLDYQFVDGSKRPLAELEVLRNEVLGTFSFTTSSRVQDWQLYKNEKYGFEFKYPPLGAEQQIEDEFRPGYTLQNEIAVKTKTIDNDYFHTFADFFVYENPAKLPYEEILLDGGCADMLYEEGYFYTDTIAEREVLRTKFGPLPESYNCGPVSPFIILLSPNKSKYVQLTYPYQTSSYADFSLSSLDELYKIHEDIISTLEFFETPLDKEWIEYRDERGMKLLYPPDWELKQRYEEHFSGRYFIFLNLARKIDGIEDIYQYQFDKGLPKNGAMMAIVYHNDIATTEEAFSAFIERMPNDTNLAKENIKLLDTDALKVSVNGVQNYPDGRGVYVWFPYLKGVIYISMVSSGPDNDENAAVFDEILKNLELD